MGECERLSVALERQQGGVLRKLQDLGETYNLDKKRSEAIISNLQESEKELIAAVGRLQKVANIDYKGGGAGDIEIFKMSRTFVPKCKKFL